MKLCSLHNEPLIETNLPMLSDSIPHSHFSCVTRGHQLVPNKEEGIYRNTKTEHTLNGKSKQTLIRHHFYNQLQPTLKASLGY